MPSKTYHFGLLSVVFGGFVMHGPIHTEPLAEHRSRRVSLNASMTPHTVGLSAYPGDGIHL